MNDQWSGKTLWSACRVNDAAERRSSTQREMRLSTVSAPEAGPHRLGEVVQRHDEALTVHPDGQLGQVAGSGPEARLGPLADVERRLVAGAEQLLRLGLVEPDGAAGVGADLGEGDDAVHGPARRTGR